MTTIAFKDGVLAADTGIYYGGTYSGRTIKIVKDKHGQLAGLSGNLGDMSAFHEWFLGGCDDTFPEFAEKDSEGFIINNDDEIKFCGKSGRFTYIDGPFYVCGSGSHIATGALANGASAEEAVLIAVEYDDCTEKPITILKLGNES